MDYLIVVDVQKDFVDGALGTAEAVAMLPALREKLDSFPGKILVTMDTHQANYMDTQEGSFLPVPHCIQGTPGWELHEAVADLKEAPAFHKPTFGSTALVHALKNAPDVDSVELVGLCTDICVVSNALLIKAALPEIPVKVDARCCAGVTPQKHEAALQVMESCQIIVAR